MRLGSSLKTEIFRLKQIAREFFNIKGVVRVRRKSQFKENPENQTMEETTN